MPVTMFGLPLTAVKSRGRQEGALEMKAGCFTTDLHASGIISLNLHNHPTQRFSYTHSSGKEMEAQRGEVIYLLIEGHTHLLVAKADFDASSQTPGPDA